MINEDIQMPNGDFLKNYPDVTHVELINEYEREHINFEGCYD